MPITQREQAFGVAHLPVTDGKRLVDGFGFAVLCSSNCKSVNKVWLLGLKIRFVVTMPASRIHTGDEAPETERAAVQSERGQEWPDRPDAPTAHPRAWHHAQDLGDRLPIDPIGADVGCIRAKPPSCLERSCRTGANDLLGWRRGKRLWCHRMAPRVLLCPVDPRFSRMAPRQCIPRE
jgi:hypothetical protein